MSLRKCIPIGLLLLAHWSRTFLFAEDLPIRVVQLDENALREFDTGPFERNFDHPTVRCVLAGSFLFGPDEFIISRIQREVYEHIEDEFGIISSNCLSHTGEAIIAISTDRTGDRMLALTRKASEDLSIVGAFSFSPTELGIVVRPRKSDAGVNDVLFTWNLLKDEVSRSKLRSRLWLIQDALAHDAVKLDEAKLDEGEVVVVAPATNQGCLLSADESILDLLRHDTYLAHLGRPFFLPTADVTSFISVHGRKMTICCIDPTCDQGIRWKKERREIESTTRLSFLLGICEIDGVARPSKSCHLLLDGLLLDSAGATRAIYTRWSTATGALEQISKLAVGEKWMGLYCHKPSISKDGRWLAMISLDANSNKALRIYDLENDAKYVEMPYEEEIHRSWDSYSLVGIRKNDTVVLKAKCGFWEVDLRTAQLGKRIFELPRKMPEVKP